MKKTVIFLFIILFVIFDILYVSSAPTVTLNDPVNTFNSSSRTIIFNATATDSVSLINMTLYANFSGSWAANVTNSSPVNNTLTNLTAAGIPQGRYIWNVYSCSSGGCAFATSNRTVTVDILPPSISNPNVNSTSIDVNGSFCVNATVTDNLAGVSTAFAEIYNTTAYVNYTMTDAGSTSCDGSGGDGVYGANIQATTEGIWKYTSVWANDTGGKTNTNDFADINITVDSTNPTITINSPTAGQTLTSSNVTLNISFSDNVALSYCSYNITNSLGTAVVNNTTITCGNSSVDYQTISDGSGYVLTAFANDTSNHINITNRTFSVDTSVAVTTPSGGGGSGGCITLWNCTNWSACTNGIQTRTCPYPSAFCAPTVSKPEESRACTASETGTAGGNANAPETMKNETVTEPKSAFGIISAVVGTAKKFILFLALGGVIVLGLISMKGKRSRKKMMHRPTEKISFLYKDRRFSVSVKECSELEKATGLMFKSEENASPLLFSFEKPTRFWIHSLFVPFPFMAVWLDGKNKVVGIRRVEPYTLSVKPKKPFTKLIEIPVNRRYWDMAELLSS